MKVRLHCGDCREVLPTLETGAYRTIVTGPPYWGALPYLPEGHPEEGYDLGAETDPAAYIAGLVDIFRLARPLLTHDGALWLVSGDSLPNPDEVPDRLARALQDDGWLLAGTSAWARSSDATDRVFLFARTEHGRGRLARIPSVTWRVPAGSHPGATFYALPAALAASCIAVSTHPGDQVLDPFAGTGTVGVQASIMGRYADLIETDPRQCWLATERLRGVGAGPGCAAA